MTWVTTGSFTGIVSAHIQDNQQVLATRWFDRLRAVVPVDADEIFPSDEVLGQTPALIEAIGRFVGTPADEIASNTFVIEKARELGALRHAQRASVHQLLREYELLRNILETFVLEEIEQLHAVPEPSEVVSLLRRIHQAVGILTQTTVDMFIERYTETIADQTTRLEAFNRMVGHELRQPLSALQTAVRLLRIAESMADPDRRERSIGAIERNVNRLTDLVRTITRRSVHKGEEEPGIQQISMSAIAQETARQLREAAQDRGVEIRIAANLPVIVVDVARLELMLTNLFSNAIKYSDPSKGERVVDVLPSQVHDPHPAFEVRDNGLGMTADQVRNAFTPFYRGHADRDAELGVEGMGLGLAIVQDCAKAIGATVEIDSTPGEGTIFTIILPQPS